MQYMVMIQLILTPAKLGLTSLIIAPMASSNADTATQRKLPPCDFTCFISTGLLVSILDASFC